MNEFDELTQRCQRRYFNFSLTWQKIGSWSIKIYTGYGENNYMPRFSTDGHTDKKDAIREGLIYMRELDANKAITKAPQF